jgi:hypothetical protein
MASAKESYQSGNRLIVIRTTEQPIAVTPEEAEEIKEDLDNIL